MRHQPKEDKAQMVVKEVIELSLPIAPLRLNSLEEVVVVVDLLATFKLLLVLQVAAVK
jgi:hypothetical protein